MSFLKGLMGVSEPVEVAPERPTHDRTTYPRSVAAQARYAAAFAEPTTAGKGADVLDLSYVGCLNQIYRYEARGLIKRVGANDDHGRAILWQWVGSEK